MSTYEYITDYTSKNYTPAALAPSVFGRARSIREIAIHHWGLEGQSFLGVVQYLCNNSNNTSAHMVIEAGRVAQIVNDADVAHHAGNAIGNTISIGLELRPEATDGDYQTAAEVIADLRKTYGDLPLRPHNYWFNTACPGKWDLNRLDTMAREIANGGHVQPQPEPEPEGLTYEIQPGDVLSSIAYKYGVSIQEIADANGITDPNQIFAGAILTIPGGAAPTKPSTYTVEDGDTLSEIAQSYGIATEALAAANSIQNPDLIFTGQVLTIP